jgi:hypothetical protein
MSILGYGDSSSMKKKAFMKTVEILLVIIITSIFMIIIFPKQSSTQVIRQDSYLINMEKDIGFRDFIILNKGCFNSSSGLIINNIIERYLPKEYDYIFCSDDKASQVPLKKITIDSLFIAGNITSINFKTVRLYYWTKD